MSTCHMKLWKDWNTHGIDYSLLIYQVSASIIFITELGVEAWVEEHKKFLRSSRRCRGFRKQNWNEKNHPLGCWLQNFHATKVGQDWWTWFLTWCSCGARCGSTFANSLVPCSCAPGASHRSDPGSTQVSKFHSSAVCRSFLIALQSSKCGTCDIGSISCPSCSLAIFQMAIICSPFHMILSCTAKALLAKCPSVSFTLFLCCFGRWNGHESPVYKHECLTLIQLRQDRRKVSAIAFSADLCCSVHLPPWHITYNGRN